MRRQVIAAALVGTLALVGCTSQPAKTADETPAVDEGTTVEKEDPEEVVEEEEEEEEEAEPEVKTAAMGEPIDYASNIGGTFVITVDGFERSQESTDWAKEFDSIDEGYAEYYLLLTIQNVDVAVDPSQPSGFGRIWIEDADGVTVNPASVGFSYGEYGNAADFTFFISEGQTIKIDVPYQLIDGSDGYTLVVDGTRVPLTISEGNRTLS